MTLFSNLQQGLAAKQVEEEQRTLALNKTQMDMGALELQTRLSSGSVEGTWAFKHMSELMSKAIKSEAEVERLEKELSGCRGELSATREKCASVERLLSTTVLAASKNFPGLQPGISKLKNCIIYRHACLDVLSE